MRQINFVIGFVITFALVLFSLENPGLVTIRIVPSAIELQLPLCVAVIAAMGSGAVLAWILSVWGGLQARIAQGNAQKRIREQERTIESLKEDLGRYKVDLDKKQRVEQLQEDLEKYKAALDQPLLPAAEKASKS
ncbi:MAG: lipopolysaccharide assembly protein LapA domain-containing protein [Prochlorotrichaceae cyanobacterium]|jgi:uncharacterized membrane protein YciS (DUF1049 family)